MEEYTQQQHYPQENYEYPPSGGFAQPNEKADLLDKIRPEEVVEQIKQRLMGKEWNPSEERWERNPALAPMALTEIGATSITNLIFPASTRNISISNLTDDEIKKRLLEIIKTAMKMCLDNWDSYGIDSVAQLYFLKEIIYTNTLVALKQPENEGIRRMLNSTISESRNVSTYGEEKKHGSWAGLIRGR